MARRTQKVITLVDLPNLTVGANGKGAFKSTIQNVIGYDLVSSSDSRGERHIEVSS